MRREGIRDDYGYRFHRSLHHRPEPDAILSGPTSPSLRPGTQNPSSQETTSPSSAQAIAGFELPGSLKDLKPEDIQGLDAYQQTGGAAPQGGTELGAT